MNYNHAYHAGNFADVFKHSILCVLMDSLQKKDKPCVYIDTHAGLGNYRLDDERALKTQEAQGGVIKLMNESSYPIELSRYLKAIEPYMNSNNKIYPGSPQIIKDCLRDDDELIVNELNVEVAQALKKIMGKDRQVKIHQRDAYEFLLAVLPPKIRRGLILIDPPFEKKDEYAKIQNTLVKALNKFSTGVYVIWYPIVDMSDCKSMRKIRASVKNESLLVEMKLTEIFRANRGLSGAGVLIVNPPWQSDVAIEVVVKYLCQLFASNKKNSWQIDRS